MKLIQSVFLFSLLALLSACSDEKVPVTSKQLNQFADTGSLTKVILSTSHGDIELGLDAKRAPGTVKNFLAYIESGHFNGTIFHRVIKNFMIQGGGFTIDYQQKDTLPSIQNEANNGLKNEKYTIAMARTGAPHSATAQFFINTKNNPFLNFTNETLNGWGYTVFGTVLKGHEVVDKIENSATGSAGPFPTDAPQQQVVIKSVSLVQ